MTLSAHLSRAHAAPVTASAPRPVPSSGRRRHRADIQGLRGVAVALVIADHADLGPFQGGFIGVDVFFVVSGYLITDLVLREAAATGTVSLTRFYARRARRILPAATVVLVAVCLAAVDRLSVARVEDVSEDVRYAAAFAANVHFSTLGTDYFAQGRATSPVQHYWSLAVEEQFYLVWPLAVLVALTVVRGRWSRPVAVAVAAGALLASLLWAVHLTAVSPVGAYFGSLCRAWEIAAGALLALCGDRLPALGSRSRQALAAGGLTAVLVAATTFRPTTPVPGLPALLPVLGTAAVLAAAAAGPLAGPGSLLQHRALTRLGDLSYSLYLWHWPVLVLGPEYAPGTASTGTGRALLVAVAVGLALLTYELVEDPVRRLRGRSAGRVAVLLCPLTAVAVLGSSAWATDTSRARLEARVGVVASVSDSGTTLTSLRRVTPPDDRHRHRRHAEPPSLRATLRTALAAAADHRPVPFPLRNLEGDRWERHYCSINGIATAVRWCPVGDARAQHPLVVAYGDSHLGQWLPALDLIGRRRHVTIVPFVKAGCSPYDVRTTDGSTAEFTSCYTFRTWVLDEIRKLRPDAVLIGSRTVFDRLILGEGQDARASWGAGVAATLRDVQPLTKSVLVMADTVELDREPADCLTDPDSDLGDCVGVQPHEVASANAVVRRVAAEQDAGFVDARRLSCVGSRCPVVVGQVVTYGDYGHLSATWVRTVAADLGRMLAGTGSFPFVP